MVSRQVLYFCGELCHGRSLDILDVSWQNKIEIFAWRWIRHSDERPRLHTSVCGTNTVVDRLDSYTSPSDY